MFKEYSSNKYNPKTIFNLIFSDDSNGNLGQFMLQCHHCEHIIVQYSRKHCDVINIYVQNANLDL